MTRLPLVSITFVLGLSPFRVGASSPDELVLNNAVGGGACALSYSVVDRVFDRETPRNRLNPQGTFFLNDGCDIDRRILLGVDGQSLELHRVRGSMNPKRQGSRMAFAGNQYTVGLSIGRLIKSFHDADTGCTEHWHEAVVVIGHKGKELKVLGTFLGGCP